MIGKGKGKSSDKNKQTNILYTIADEMTCPISNEPADRLYILKCQHVISLNYLTKLKQKICPICREIIEEENLQYLSQNTIYKNIKSRFEEADYILKVLKLKIKTIVILMIQKLILLYIK